MKPLILSPLILSPLIVSPLIVSPLIVSPLIVSPLIVSPLIVSPLIASPLSVGKMTNIPYFVKQVAGIAELTPPEPSNRKGDRAEKRKTFPLHYERNPRQNQRDRRRRTASTKRFYPSSFGKPSRSRI